MGRGLYTFKGKRGSGEVIRDWLFASCKVLVKAFSEGKELGCGIKEQCMEASRHGPGTINR